MAHDFTDYANRIALAAQGIFSIDQQAHRARRQAEADERQMIDAAYVALGLDQRREHAKIAGECQRNDGVWAQSSGEYTRARNALDQGVADHVYGGC